MKLLFSKFEVKNAIYIGISERKITVYLYLLGTFNYCKSNWISLASNHLIPNTYNNHKIVHVLFIYNSTCIVQTRLESTIENKIFQKMLYPIQAVFKFLFYKEKIIYNLTFMYLMQSLRARLGGVVIISLCNLDHNGVLNFE